MQGGLAVQFYCHPTITAAEARAAAAAAAGFGQLLIKHHHLLQKPLPQCAVCLSTATLLYISKTVRQVFNQNYAAFWLYQMQNKQNNWECVTSFENGLSIMTLSNDLHFSNRNREPVTWRINEFCHFQFQQTKGKLNMQSYSSSRKLIQARKIRLNK